MNAILRLIWNEVRELYVRGEVTLTKDALVLEPGRELSFDTYFNSLACDVWSRHTPVREMIAMVETDGTATVSLWHRSLSGEVLISQNTGTGIIKLPFSLPQSGIVYCKVQSADQSVRILGGGFYVADEPLNDISIAIVICTYRREDYVRRNVRSIVDYSRLSGIDFDVFVVDNGGTLTESDVEGAILVHNPNLGGSGGFCRGLAEAKMANRYTHVLFMDDDVSFEGEILGRSYAFLRYVTNVDGVGLGASMMAEETPTIQFELGAKWNGDRLIGLGKKVDLTDSETLLSNATRHAADYTAWWYCCMPLSVVDRVGYPMPFFIKNDDVEYGVRSGLDWAFLSGVGVWHSSFESKYSPYLEYYIKRNELISNCLNRHRGCLSQFTKLVRGVALQLVQQRYFVIPFMFEGYNDFLKGPQFLMNLDAAVKNKELIAAQPRQFTAEELLAMGYDVSVPMRYDKKNKLLSVVTLNSQAVPTFLYSKKDRVRVLDSNNCPPHDFFGAVETVQFNYLSGKGFVTHLQRYQLFKWGFALMGMGVKMLFRYPTVRRQYQRAMYQLASLDFWQTKWADEAPKDKM